MTTTTRRESEGDDASTALVKVETEKVAACMTCPICNRLFTDATTISECLHTFCRKCIYDKITDETLYRCPVCNIDLGGTPIEKLRADHNLQDLRAKIFFPKSPKPNVPKLKHPPVHEEAEAPLQLLGRRKERSISSLVLGRSKASINHHGKRTTPVSVRKKKRLARGLEHHLSRDDADDDWLKGFVSPDIAKRVSLISKLTSAAASSSKKRPLKISSQKEQVEDEKADLLKPLRSLVDASSKSEPKKSILEEADDQVKLSNGDNSEAHPPKAIAKEHGCNKGEEVDGGGKRSIAASSASGKQRKLRQGVQPERVAVTQDLNMPAQAAVETGTDSDDGRFSPVWFSLIASNDQGGVAPLPQISSCYLRVKDGSLPVSTIKKYLVRKLGLASDAEVEIWLEGQPVLSTLQLHNLVDWWLQTTPAASKRTEVTIGSSAEEFVMVLFYGRKTQPSFD